MRRKKIAVLIPRLGIVERGTENTTWELVNRLCRNFDITVICKKSDHKFVEIPGLSFVKVGCITLGSRWKFLDKMLGKYLLDVDGFEFLTFSLAAFVYIVPKQFDLVFPNNGVWGVIVAWMYRIIKGTKFIHRTNGGIEPVVAKFAPDVIIAEQPVAYDWYKKYFPKINLLLISPGVDIERFSCIKKVKNKLQRPVFLCVGALIEHKRQDLAIKAVARLRRGSLVLVGEGERGGEYRELGEKLLGRKRFAIFNRIEHDKMWEVYAGADVFTLPSWEEPFGIVYLEAMAMNLPVVATNDRQRKYIIGKAGLICDVMNSENYAKCLQKASKKKFRNMPRRQAEKFGWEKTYLKYNALINDLLQ